MKFLIELLTLNEAGEHPLFDKTYKRYGQTGHPHKEHCIECDALTGKAGEGDDSLYDKEGNGPYCEDCWTDLPEAVKESASQAVGWWTATKYRGGYYASEGTFKSKAQAQETVDDQPDEKLYVVYGRLNDDTREITVMREPVEEGTVLYGERPGRYVFSVQIYDTKHDEHRTIKVKANSQQAAEDYCDGKGYEVIKIEQLDEGWKSTAGAVALAGAVAVGVANSPKVEIDGQMYDRAVSSAPDTAKSATVKLKGKPTKVLYWDAVGPKHNRKTKVYKEVE
jgi:hypothetical protein